MPEESNRDGYRLAHTMMRVRDLEASFNFYCKTLGMKILRKTDYPDGKFTNAFIGYGLETESPCLELTHNWGTESDDSFSYHDGNSDPRGFGHIGITVPDVYEASENFEKHGVEFVKKPDDGNMKGLAFIKDPDGYWIEILSASTSSKF